MNATNSSKICRICCNQKTDHLISLLDTENKIIVKKLRACADVTIERDDLLPKYICTKCMANLNAAYNFKLQCEYMDQKFRETITISLRKHKALKLGESDNTSLEFGGSGDESSSFEFDSGQTTMDDVETIFEEEEEGEDEYLKTEQITLNNQVLLQPGGENNQVHHLQNVQHLQSNLETYVMDVSPKMSEVEKENSFGLLPIAKAEECVDQEMFSVKSDPISSPRNKRSFKCETCQATFSIHAEYNKHTKTHGKNRFQCLVCNRWFGKRYLLNAHQKTHSGNKPFECNICQKRYTNQSNLDRHVRVFHKKERLHTCTTCRKTFAQLSTLRLHQSVHVAVREFACDLCNNKFKSEIHLKLHQKRHMPTEHRPKRKYSPPKKAYKPTQKLCVCNECGKRFTSLALLRSHKQSHSLEKKYECKYCKKRFSFQQTLRNHIFIHTGEKRFKCDVCNISFRQISHLQGHKLVHSGVKPHTCTVCGKAFALRGNLSVHMRTHTNTTPFSCSICPRKFNDSNTLKRHHLMHQRKNQTNPLVEQILQAPIIEEQQIQIPNQVPIQSTIIQPPVMQAQIAPTPVVGTPFNIMPSFNVNPETISDNTQFIFKIE